MRNVSYGDELYLLSLVLKEIEQGARLDLESPRFVERLQTDMAFLDESLAEYEVALTATPHLPGKLEYLRRLARLHGDFATLLTALGGSDTPVSRAFSPLRETLGALSQRHAGRAKEIRRMLREGSEQGSEAADGISPEEFQILLAGEEPEAGPP